MTKEALRVLFEQYKGEFLSGEKIAEELGVSRAAIWKAINQLKAEGYDIESVKKKGYCLNTNSDILSFIKMREYLEVSIEEQQVIIHKQIDSTNKQALLAGIEGAGGWTIITAEEQTNGMAKNKQVFQSPKGKGVYLSLLLTPDVKQDSLGDIASWSREIVIDTLQDLTGLRFVINTNNEITYSGKKVCGIMIQQILELQTQCIQYLVIGIGINVYGEEDYFGVEHESNISLYGITKQYYNRSQLIAMLINRFYNRYNHIKKGAR